LVHQPNALLLSGETYNASLRVYVPVSPPSAALLAQLNETGVAVVGLKGTFGLACGTLRMTLDYFQPMAIPNCALEYVRTHPGGGVCGACS
jgi:hypothetical protein